MRKDTHLHDVEDNVHCADLGVKRIPGHVVLTQELCVVCLRQLQLALASLEQVDVLEGCLVRPLKLEIFSRNDTVSVLHQDEGGIGKSIPDGRKISRDPRVEGLHCCENKHDGQIDCNDGLKEERLEVDSDVAHQVEQDRRQVDCQDAA